MKPTRKAALIILDGWGLGQVPEADAIAAADTPFMDSMYNKYPNTKLTTHGKAVGLPPGQMGNSEVGHLNIGAGRIVYQELVRINKAIEDGSLAENPVLNKALDYAIKHDKPVHLMGLVSDGGVHSHIDHLIALCNILAKRDLPAVYIHAFTDGRDTDPKSAPGFINQLQHAIDGTNITIASLVGRYYGMDRDKRWERIKLAYDLIVDGKGRKTKDIQKGIKEAYENGETDEFIKPIVCVDEDEKPVATLKDEDVLICFNFRTDRPRQISEVLTQKAFPEFAMEPLDLKYVTMTNYDDRFEDIDVLFEENHLKNTMGEVLQDQGITQLRIAETEKYPHVSFFFSGGREALFEGEDRIMVPSPKVATYDLQPEMSAIEVTDKVIEAIESDEPGFICLNYANADMVGHTGVFKAAVTAVETVDDCLKRLVPVLLDHDYDSLIIADHGNSDYLINEDGSPNTAHTMNPVPCILVTKKQEWSNARLFPGKLADIAPTLLALMNINPPAEFSGDNLISNE